MWFFAEECKLKFSSSHAQRLLRESVVCGRQGDVCAVQLNRHIAIAALDQDGNALEILGDRLNDARKSFEQSADHVDLVANREGQLDLGCLLDGECGNLKFLYE